ncbi:hypothetical protein PSHT_06205 [Puccinia striiformis]|uniref:Reverse transcriptase Ty1/copia-type domain-containing protein n=1 Tax=Puccinia striiformis TaxID=27350 RepID=A0A2S4W8M6_9BASI|nr:hypothetical protein PSHT_06205 [Puccinia striiformis]
MNNLSPLLSGSFADHLLCNCPLRQRPNQARSAFRPAPNHPKQTQFHQNLAGGFQLSNPIITPPGSTGVYPQPNPVDRFTNLSPQQHTTTPDSTLQPTCYYCRSSRTSANNFVANESLVEMAEIGDNVNDLNNLCFDHVVAEGLANVPIIDSEATSGGNALLQAKAILPFLVLITSGLQSMVFSISVPSMQPQFQRLSSKLKNHLNGSSGRQQELQNLDGLQVWSVEVAPHGRKPLKGCWVFAEKMDDHGNITQYKAGYVVKGFTQQEGRDCGATFAATASFVSMCILLTLAAWYNWKVHSFDFVAAYLNLLIDEDIWVEAPEGLKVPAGHAMRLQNALYGTCQAVWCWWLHLKGVLTSLGFTASQYDNNLYTIQHSNKVSIIWVHIITSSSDTAKLQKLAANSRLFSPPSKKDFHPDKPLLRPGCLLLMSSSHKKYQWLEAQDKIRARIQSDNSAIALSVLEVEVFFPLTCFYLTNLFASIT